MLYSCSSRAQVNASPRCWSAAFTNVTQQDIISESFKHAEWGALPCKGYIGVCAAVKGMVFKQFTLGQAV